MLAGFLAGNNNNELGDLAAVHPLFELGHDFLDVGFDLVIGRYCSRSSVSQAGLGT